MDKQDCLPPKPFEITCLNDIVDQFEFFFCDMYGLLWDGNHFYPGVLKTLEMLKERGKKIYILSNVTTLREKFIPDKAAKGLIYQKHYDEVITSGDVCAAAIQEGLFEQITGNSAYKVAVIGKENKEMFAPITAHQTQNIQEADVIYLSGVQIDKPYETIDHLIPALKEAFKRNLPAVCANPDLTFMSGAKQLPTQGSLARWYETRGGYVHYFGKPYYNIYEYALHLTNADKSRSLMAGDTLETDILGGQNAQMKTVLVTQTGLTSYYLNLGDSLQNQFKKAKTTPDFIMPHFSILD